MGMAAVRAQRVHYHWAYEGFITLLLLAQLSLGFWELPSNFNVAGMNQGFATSLIAEVAILLVLAVDTLLVQRPAYGPSRWLKRGWVSPDRAAELCELYGIPAADLLRPELRRVLTLTERATDGRDLI